MYWGDKRVIAVGGGQGGVGKSTFVANLGVALASQGKHVTVIDADFVGSNLHTIIGVRYPEKTLDDFFSNREADLENSLVDTPYPHLRLLSSAGDMASISSPNYRARQRLYRAIRNLKTDIIIFDLAAGNHQRATDFFTIAPIRIILAEPTPASLDNAYLFLRDLLVRGLVRTFYHEKETTAFIKNTVASHSPDNTFHLTELLIQLRKTAPAKVEAYRQIFLQSTAMHVVVNSTRSQSQQEIAEKFARRAKRYLAVNLVFSGTLPYEPNMDQAVIGRVPFIVKYPESQFKKNLLEIIGNLEL